MALSMRAAVIVLAVLSFSPDVQAVPTFTWEGNWNIALLSNCIAHSDPSHPDICTAFNGARAFGASATQDGQILNTTSDTGLAKSQWSAALGPNAGQTGVTFSRAFLLSGASEGWTVSLSGLLTGSAFAGGTNTADVTAAASILPSLNIMLHDHAVDPRTGPIGHPVSLAQLQTAMLADGSYTVSGSLLTGASGGNGVAGADFFGNVLNNGTTFGFAVNVSASPVPEPSTLLLLVTGLVGAAWGLQKKGVTVTPGLIVPQEKE